MKRLLDVSFLCLALAARLLSTQNDAPALRGGGQPTRSWEELGSKTLSIPVVRNILTRALQGASRPREGTIPPELFGSSEHQPHFCPS